MINRKILLSLMLSGLSPAAFAYDTEYVVVGGFSTVVNAFTRLKFVFNDNQYTMLVAAFVFMGLVSALLFRGAKNGIEYLETGKGQMGLGWLGLTLIGTMFYFGLVQNKGTVHIYDQTRNQYQAVSGIPDFLTVTAGLTNSVYQAFVDISNRDTATTTRFSGEGTAIKMLLNLVSRNGSPFDPYITDSVKAMWQGCEPVAEARGFDPRTVKSGANALDMVNALSPLRNQATYSVWYSNTAPSGTTVTCDQAYTNLKAALGGTAAYDNRLKDICTKSGYAVANTAEYVACKGRIESDLQTLFGSSSLSLNSIMSNVLVSQAISDALIANNPEVAATMVANRSMMNGGLADATTNPEWMSTIMAAVLAIILAITPMLVLLVFTPLMAKALTLLFGLWVFITTWQIADVMLLQASTDEIITVMSEIKTLGLGIDSMQLAPSAAMKAMSVMGSARTSAVQIATLVAGLFGVSAFGIGAFGQRALSKLDRTSDEVSDKTFTTEGRGHLINDTRAGLAAQGALSTVGMEKLSASSMYGDLSNVNAANAQIQGLGGGNVGQAAMRAGEVHGGQQVGQVMGYESALPGISAGQAATFSSQVNAENDVGSAVGRTDAANAAGMNVADQARVTSSTSATMQTADAQSNLDNANGSLRSLHEQQKQLHGTERQTEIGTSEGTLDAAAAANMSVSDMTRERTSVNTSADYGRTQGTLNAAGGDLSAVQNREETIAGAASAEGMGHANALHNAYGDTGGIERGVTATQTEQTKQHAVDMERQHDLVERIQSKDGSAGPVMSEAEARRSLSDANGAQATGALRANDFDGKKVEEVATYDATKHVAHNAGEQAALAENGKETVPYFAREGEVTANRSIANQDKFDELSGPLGGDQNLAKAEAGAGTHLVINDEQAKSLNKAGLIDERQANSVADNGVAKVDMSVGHNNKGQMVSTGSVNSGHNTTIDNSEKEDRSLSINLGTDTGNGNSGQHVLSDIGSVHKILTSNNAIRPGSGVDVLANEAAHSVEGIVTARKEKTDATSLSGGIKAGFGAGGMGGSVGASAGANGSTTDSDNESINAIRGSFKTQIEKMQAEGTREAEMLNLSGDAKQQYVDDYTARTFPRYYNDFVKHANSDSMEAGLETSQNKFNEKWNEQHGINTRSTVPEIPTNTDGSTKNMSPQEYLWRQGQLPATETASENLARTVAQENASFSHQQGGSSAEPQGREAVKETVPAQAATPYVEPAVRTVYRKSSDSDENTSQELTEGDDSGMHPPVKSGAHSNGIPVANKDNANNGKAPR